MIEEDGRIEWNTTSEEYNDGYGPVYDQDELFDHESGELLSGLPDDMLKNEVYPIFRRTNFPAANYDKLLPALRLATMFLDSDCLRDYWHILWFGEERQVLHEDGTHHWAYFKTRSKMTAKDKAMTRARLWTLADMVRFHRSKSVEGGRADQSDSLLELKYPEAFGDFSGCTTTVLYAEWVYQEMLDVLYRGFPETKLRVWFSFAILMLHEVAHAAHSAASGRLDELPFESQTMAEAGYEFESQVLGGALRTCWCDQTQSIAIWPTASIGKEYLHRKMATWVMGECPDVEIQWDVPLSYVRNLFSTHFWKKKVTAEGAATLQVPKLRGYLNKANEDGSTVRLWPRAADGEFEKWLPEDCCLEDEDEAAIEKVAPGFEFDGFGRLLLIDYHEFFEGRSRWRPYGRGRGWASWGGQFDGQRSNGDSEVKLGLGRGRALPQGYGPQR